MPTSQPYQISKIIKTIINSNPKSVLDIGVGFGKYGVLCREYLEFYDGREKYNEFNIRIDGIEAFNEYITPVHKYVYDNIYIGNALDLIDTIDTTYDLVIMIDVLEHFEKKDGKKLILKLLQHNKGILISIPKCMGVHPEAFGNIYEIHKSQWSKNELAELHNSYFVKDHSNYIVYLGSKENINILVQTHNKRTKDIFFTKTRRFIGKIPFVKMLYIKFKSNGV